MGNPHVGRQSGPKPSCLSVRTDTQEVRALPPLLGHRPFKGREAAAAGEQTVVGRHPVSLLLPHRETTAVKMAPRGAQVPKPGAKEHLAWSHLPMLK